MRQDDRATDPLDGGPAGWRDWVMGCPNLRAMMRSFCAQYTMLPWVLPMSRCGLG